MNNFLSIDPIILFFILGFIASYLKSDLKLPEDIAKTFSIFLLLSIGIKGGQEVGSAKDLHNFVPTLSVGLAASFVMTLSFFFFLKSKIGSANSASLSASYGSVSAITLMVAQSFLKNQNIHFSGYMVTIMALIEIPAIIFALFLYQKNMKETKSSTSVLKSIITSKSIFLLIGGFLIGLSLNEASWLSIKPIFKDSFKGILAIYILNLGVIAQKRVQEVLAYTKKIFFFVVIFPLLTGSIVILISHLINISFGDQILLGILTGSASYIAAPAAIQSTIKEANPSFYIGLPLGITFSINLLFGIPYYVFLAQLVNS